ncbi:MAG: hypothetical protein JNL12_19690 [Planctomycetes bacterium]|nr:hypothetical protein [Planctomycetota bacterium]
MTRSRLLGLLTVFCALWFVLPSCFTIALWQNTERREYSNGTRAEPSGAWFADDGTDTLVIALPPDVVEQVAWKTDFLPKDAVGLMLTSPGLRTRARESGASDQPWMVHIRIDADGQPTITSSDEEWPSPELQVLDALPPRGEALDRGIELHLRKNTVTGGMVWLRVMVTPVAVALDIVTLPLTLPLTLFYLLVSSL